MVDALQRVTDAALAHLPEEDLLAELLLRVTEILEADTAAILILDEDRDVFSARARGIEEEVEQGVEIPVGGGFAGRIAAERQAIVIDDVDHADILNPILREKGIHSLLGVPLLVEGRVIGVMHVGSLLPRRFTPAETDLLQLAADRAAIAIEHATLFQQERVARLASEAARSRLEALQQITDASLAYLPQDELLEELLRRIARSLETDTAAILLLDEPQGVLRAHAARGIEEEVEQGVTIPLGKGFAGRVAAERRIIAIPDIDQAEIVNPILREKGIKSLLGVPLLVEGRVLGVMHVGTLSPRQFTEAEGDLLQLAADRAAVAIEHVNLYEQRRLAEALQREMLRTDLTSSSITPRLDVASRYLPATGESFGGDWYDAFMLPGGRIAMAVGDVVGHGVGAAAVMAQLRTALRAYAADGHDPVGVIERVNGLMLELGPATMTTLVYVVFDPELHSAEIVNAGHPPALLVEPGGGSRFLEMPAALPLGVDASHDLRPALRAIHRRIDAGALHRRPRRGARRVPGRGHGAPAACGRACERGRGALRRGGRVAHRRRSRGRRRPGRRARTPSARPAERHLACESLRARRAPPVAARMAEGEGSRNERELRPDPRLPGGVRERHRARLRAGPPSSSSTPSPKGPRS